MKVINARNVSEAWALFHVLMTDPSAYRVLSPRGVKTAEILTPVATVYTRPEECVLLDPVRDCNPFFHLYEALWILAGRRDVARLRYYNPQIQVYSDDQDTFHGAYGNRMQWASGVNQLDALIVALKADRDSRRGVISLWLPQLDVLATAEKGSDIPCNTTLYFKIRDDALRLTVCNRSNDAVWGAYGANAVQFSILQQYVAAAIGVPVGPYTQVSDSLHVYLEGKAGEVWARCAASPPPLLGSYKSEYVYSPLVVNAGRFHAEVYALTSPTSGRPGFGGVVYQEPFVTGIAIPLLTAFEAYRERGPEAGLELLNPISNKAWIRAGIEWLARRAANRAKKAQVAA